MREWNSACDYSLTGGRGMQNSDNFQYLGLHLSERSKCFTDDAKQTFTSVKSQRVL